MQYGVIIFPKTAIDGITDWIARFPGVVGLENCIGSGKTPTEALEEAFGNLNAILEYLKAEGKPMPIAAHFETKTIQIPLFAPSASGVGAFA